MKLVNNPVHVMWNDRIRHGLLLSAVMRASDLSMTWMRQHRGSRLLAGSRVRMARCTHLPIPGQREDGSAFGP
jgi:hypothetical protein